MAVLGLADQATDWCREDLKTGIPRNDRDLMEQSQHLVERSAIQYVRLSYPLSGLKCKRIAECKFQVTTRAMPTGQLSINELALPTWVYEDIVDIMPLCLLISYAVSID